MLISFNEIALQRKAAAAATESNNNKKKTNHTKWKVYEVFASLSYAIAKS